MRWSEQRPSFLTGGAEAFCRAAIAVAEMDSTVMSGLRSWSCANHENFILEPEGRTRTSSKEDRLDNDESGSFSLAGTDFLRSSLVLGGTDKGVGFLRLRTPVALWTSFTPFE